MSQCSSSRCISSAEVVSKCEDLLAEILVRLPLHSAFMFKCVSKSWNHLISDPIFCTNYQSQRKKSVLPLLGFFRCTHSEDGEIQLSFLQNLEQKKLTKLDYIEGYTIRHISPEGLMLCNADGNVKHYYVCNPIINQWFALPQHPVEFLVPVSIVCEECSKDGVVHFKVIRALFPTFTPATCDSIHIETFCSRTGNWSESFLTSPSEFSFERMWFQTAETVGGIVYWKILGYLVAYDPGMRENRVWLIKLPPFVCKRVKEENRDIILSLNILGQSADGHLRFAFTFKEQFFVWDLKEKLSGYNICHVVPSSEWRLKEVVDFNKLNLVYSASRYDKYPSLKSFHPQNSELVYLRAGSGIGLFCYDFETRRLERIKLNEGTFLPSYQIIPYFEPPWRPCLPG